MISGLLMGMDKSELVRNVGIKLPIGFRFHPTDEELVVHYLRRKVLSFPLPASVIPEVDVFQVNPWDLPGSGEPSEKKYFFCRRKGNAAKSSRTTGSGYWKDVGKEKYIAASGSNQAVGVKKSLVFCDRKRPRGLRTRWVMHEYRLLGFLPTSNSAQKLVMMETEEWVVCRIYQKKRKPKNKSDEVKAADELAKGNKARSSIVDIIMEGNGSSGPPQPTSSCSSGITELSHSPSDQEETSSCVASLQFLTN